MSDAIKKKSWKEFQDSKLLWWVNRSLHLFGWAIVLEVADNGGVLDAYPARVTFRGFDTESESEGFKGLTKYMSDNSSDLWKEATEE